MKFLVTGVSMFNNFIPTLTEYETYLHLNLIYFMDIGYRYKPPFRKQSCKGSVVSRID
jgi:hypothetical protein